MMSAIDTLPPETSWQEDSFRFIKPDEFKTLGIDPGEIPQGTFAALRHPSQLPSRFGGNAYGFGLFEVYDRLSPEDVEFLQSIAFENPESVRKHCRNINAVYEKIGLLIRFSSLGKPYYLVPANLVSNTITHIKSKVAEISEIISSHRKRSLKEHLDIGLLTQKDDLITQGLSFPLKDHHLMVLDDLEKLQEPAPDLDLVILTRDIYEIVLMYTFSPHSQHVPSKERLDQYATYILWKIYCRLKSGGELFMIANHYTPQTNRTAKIRFHNNEEIKQFLIFNHLFKTQKRHKTKGRSLQVNVFDFQKYLSGLYVEQAALEKLLGDKRQEDMTIEQVDTLPYLNLHLSDLPFLSDQGNTWARLFSIFFEKMFLRPFLPQSVKDGWEKRFSCIGYSPNYMMTYLGKKKPLNISIDELMQEVTESRLLGCTPALLADYRDSFDYVTKTLQVVERLNKEDYKSLPEVFLDRLTQPLENANRRFSALNHVMKLLTKMNQFHQVDDVLNPDQIEEPKTPVLKNLEALCLFGFSYDELKEVILIVLGHTSLGRVISGKMNEKTLKPVSDLARTYDQKEAINLLRYCRLMTMAEIEAARGTELRREQLVALFDVYESTVRVVTNRDLDWDELLDEKTSIMGGVHNRVIRKLLMMMNHFEFLDNWSELRQKGKMEKEALAGYDDGTILKIENVIKLVNTIEQFEKMYFKTDPLELPAFYRRLLNIEFHGTGHIFGRMDSELVFRILWIAVNLARGEIINFNPLVSDVETADIDERIKKVAQEASVINTQYMDLPVLRQFSTQLYQSKSSYILGTGLQIRVNPETQALEIAYMDRDRDFVQMDSLSEKMAMDQISNTPVEDLVRLEALFSNLESFYQSHQRLHSQNEYDLKFPVREIQWHEKAESLRQKLKMNLLSSFFQPEDIFNNLDRLNTYAPSLLRFILPEFAALEDLDLSWNLYLTSPVTHYILTATRKLQALIRHDKESLQDTRFMHELAQREFGPMATGIVGINESQIDSLEQIVQELRNDGPLFRALLKAFIFQDLGRVPYLRARYGHEINPADIADVGAFFVEKEDIAGEYQIDEKEKEYLVFLIRHHGLLHHIIRGEISVSALKLVLNSENRNLFEAFFLTNFLMLSAIRDDLLLEDLADRLFSMRAVCHRIMDGETSHKAQLDRAFIKRGKLLFILEKYKKEEIPKGEMPSHYLESMEIGENEAPQYIQSGKTAVGLERFLRLRGIRYVRFEDLVNLMLGVPLKFVYRERKFSSIGYATFEKEVLEAFRIYNTLQNMAEETRHFILSELTEDRVRIYGYEKASTYLSYENQIKLLLAGLMGTSNISSADSPVYLNFLGLSEKIEFRYEAVNDYLNTISIDRLWQDKGLLNHLFKAKTGLLLKKEVFPGMCSVDFQDRISISQKITHMSVIEDLEQLKNYFHSSLRSMKKRSFYTDDYELQLEQAFNKRFSEITDLILNQAKKQMELILDVRELHDFVEDLLDRALDIGFTDDQKYRLKDLYELCKDNLKRKKLTEIDKMLDTVYDVHELEDYWDSIKWHLQADRRLLGLEFESLIAKKFDDVRNKVR